MQTFSQETLAKREQSRHRLMVVCVVVTVGQLAGFISHRTMSADIAAKTPFFSIALCVTMLIGFMLAALRWRVQLTARLTFGLGGVWLVAIVISHSGVGGFHTTALLVLPALSSLVLGSRDTLYLSLFCYVSLIGLYIFRDYMPPYYLDWPAHVSATFRSLFLTMLIIMTCTYIMVREIERSDARLHIALQEQEKAATSDALTGLANRAATQAWQRAAEGAQRKVRVFLIDLDGFKDVNDTFGHAAGDAILIQLSGVLRDLVPDPSFVARLGGDEFLVGVDLSNPVVDTLGAALVTGLCAEHTNGLSTRSVSASVGVADFPADGDAISAVMQKADRALYAAKNLGKARVVVYNSDCDMQLYELDIQGAATAPRAASV
ncbi:GGDEF domain-containing protein [Yoonia sp. F2084L]|uniref:GGDEF domain-containing protein n=1 Tax=Yoonia sp. F2084L TaxID=2926419 RepID=UPI001FF63459|nr:GGDEF domain-containing protein [Yoonia sp. F2084L]MCK0095615.1 GGDEF domain-containing protein [Yoonia sp. F2084L]